MKFRNILYAFIAFIGVMIAGAWGASEYGAGTPATLYQYAWTADTITNTENDTLALPVNLLSDYQYNYTLVKTNLSGTTALKLYLQESNLTSGTTDWITVDSSVTTTTTLGRIKNTDTYGVRHRLIVDGSGTQSSKYWLYAKLKKQN